jgi:NADPH-dependent F420 reductase
MKIAIIGTGNVGTALGGSFVRAGHEVTFAAQDATATQALASQLGATAAATTSAAIHASEIVVLAIPYDAVGDIAGEIAGAVAGKVVIDATNPLKSDYSGLATADGPSGAERIADLLPGARVVKAFNTIFASIQADPRGQGQVVDGLLAGDDPEAKAEVAGLLRSMGLRPLDAGPLAEARALEAIAWLNIALQLRNGGSWTTTVSLVNPPEQAIAA